jgi:hypothetical protein
MRALHRLCDHPGVTPAERLGILETEYLSARDARDRLDVARATGVPEDVSALEADAHRTSLVVHTSLASFPPGLAAGMDEEDRRALRSIRDGIAAADIYQLPVAPAAERAACEDPDTVRAAILAGGKVLQAHVETAFAAIAADLAIGNERMTRLQVLARLGQEPDPEARRALFLGMLPLWRAVDGDGADASPYRVLVGESADRWRRGHSPVAQNAAALGVKPGDIETWALTALAAWRAAVVEPARARGEPLMEPWDWWWRAGDLQRAVDPLEPEVVMAANSAYAASLGADLDALAVTFDVSPRPGRPAVPMAFTTFGGRPHRRADGSWSPGRPVVVMTDLKGGYPELGELVHETGHAIHIAGIRTRPAFADWPDSDAVVEALADVLALDLAEPSWLRHWLPGAPEVPVATAIRSRYAEIVLDAAWAVFELKMHAAPFRRASDVWTEITGTWLGIAPHPEWSWWAIRGQLVESPGYMSNYAVGAVLATSIRASLRGSLGSWTTGSPRWYPWLRDRVFRFGLQQPSREVIHDLLGRAPTADPLLAEINRAARVG